MELARQSAISLSTQVLSGIVNWVCPECGGRMGGPGKEFKCQGRCGTDWRPIWELIFNHGRQRSLRHARFIRGARRSRLWRN
jgi:tRNA(Ile2) C34 agmatinyltransferase TiaS